MTRLCSTPVRPPIQSDPTAPKTGPNWPIRSEAAIICLPVYSLLRCPGTVFFCIFITPLGHTAYTISNTPFTRYDITLAHTQPHTPAYSLRTSRCFKIASIFVYFLHSANANHQTKTICSSPKAPLTLYLFSVCRRTVERVLNDTQSGGVCVNDTIVQLGGAIDYNYIGTVISAIVDNPHKQSANRYHQIMQSLNHPLSLSVTHVHCTYLSSYSKPNATKPTHTTDRDFRTKPLTMYVLSNQKDIQTKFLQSTSSGGACINETMMHLAGLPTFQIVYIYLFYVCKFC